MKAVITGSGFESAEWGEVAAEHRVTPVLGEPSSRILEIKSGQDSFFWLRRHGEQGELAPHRINYRANIQALAELGVTQIISVNSVGGISAGFDAGVLAIPDQIIDLTWGRESSFYDGDYLPLKHIDFTNPYNQQLSEALKQASGELGLSFASPATFACTQGPRLETAAEIKALASLGADIVGMTAMPEAALARELDITYAAICPVINAAAGLTDGLLDETEMRAQAAVMIDSVQKLIQKVLLNLAAQ